MRRDEARREREEVAYVGEKSVEEPVTRRVELTTSRLRRLSKGH